MANSKSKKDKEGVIKQGSIAQFMRKRTQLVGFDFGLFKHTQYAIEFMDNSLDAIESFQWKTRRQDKINAFQLKDDVLLENLSYVKGGICFDEFERFYSGVETVVEEDDDPLFDDEVDEDEEHEEVSNDLVEELKIQTDDDFEETDSNSSNLNQNGDLEIKTPEMIDEEEKRLAKLSLDEKELEKEVVKLMKSVEDFVLPIEPLVDREAFVIYKITEEEAPSVYADMSSQSNEDVYLYTLQIFDNGTGMKPDDLEKFGKYLASSKSIKLKQTRGSQGFGSPSAFSDAQNTTGQPIRVISKHIDHLYGMASEFYTTSKNKKSYVVPPTEVDCPFKHGTYIELKYLNVKYIKGYIDKYINRTALTNPHVSLIFIDPKNEEDVYTRKVDRFPRQPTYAKPHPSSVNIGDFQDIMRNSDNLTVSACLQENYVRMSGSIAKKILIGAEFELEKRLSIFNLGEDKGPFITWSKKPSDPLTYIQNEKRVYGRSSKKRDIIITYNIANDDNIDAYWKIVDQYNGIIKQIDKIYNNIKKEQVKIKDSSSKKEKSAVKKEISKLNKQVKANMKILKNLKNELAKAVNNFNLDNAVEVDDKKTKEQLTQKLNELIVAKTKPADLSQSQTECLYQAFRAQNYMSPPKDPAVPIGSGVLETTLMKEFNLSLSYRTDLFEDLDEELPKLQPELADRYVKRILSKFIKPPYYNPEYNPLLGVLKEKYDDFAVEAYSKSIIEYEVLDQKISDDFIVAETRKPTSGKGLAFVVEAAMAISPKIRETKRSTQTLMRYVNRTPKLRDNADCAIWRAVQEVNWKLYKLETFDNGMPKGHLRLLVNVSGPYVHLMFKSQSKNALAEDKVLLKEMKLCLQALGRRIRTFQNKKKRRKKEMKRSETIGRFIPKFVNSLVNLASKIEGLEKPNPKVLEERLFDRLEGNLNALPQKASFSNKGKSEKNLDKTPDSKQDIDSIIETDQKSQDNITTKEDMLDDSEDQIEDDESIMEEFESAEISNQNTLESLGLDIKDLVLQFEEENPGKRALWRDSETKTFSEWKNEKIVERLQGKTTAKASSKSSSKKPHKVLTIEERKELAKEKQQAKERSTQPTQSTISTKSEDIKSKTTSDSKTQQTLTKKKSSQKTLTPVKKPDTKKKVEKIEDDEEDEPRLKKLKKPQSKLDLLTDESILGAFEPKKWYNIKEIIQLLKISNMNDARYLQLKLRSLSRKKDILVQIKSGKKIYMKK